MHFILIYYLLANAGGYATTGTAEFDDKPSCDGALKELGSQWPGDLRGALPGICVPKGQQAAPTTAVSPPSGSVRAAAPKASP